MNLVFHLVAALVLIGLSLMLLRVQRDRDRLRLLFKVAAKDRQAIGKINVDWPLQFLSDFARCLDIPMVGSGSLRIGEPQKIEIGPLVALYLEGKIQSISYDCGSNGSMVTALNLVMKESSSIPVDDVEAMIERALKVKGKVTLVPG